MSKQVIIYGLKDLETGEISYIGRTNDLGLRLLQRTYQKTLDAASAAVVELARVDADEASIAERQWIYYGRQQGWPLLNEEGSEEAATPFGDWLVDELGKRGWSYNEMGRRSGLTHAIVSMVINGKTNPGTSFCTAIATALGIPHVEVFRRAGLLPPERDPNPHQRKLMAITDNLGDDAMETLLNVANALLIREQVGHSDNGRE